MLREDKRRRINNGLCIQKYYLFPPSARAKLAGPDNWQISCTAYETASSEIPLWPKTKNQDMVSGPTSNQFLHFLFYLVCTTFMYVQVQNTFLVWHLNAGKSPMSHTLITHNQDLGRLASILKKHCSGFWPHFELGQFLHFWKLDILPSNVAERLCRYETTIDEAQNASRQDINNGPINE